MLTLVLGGTRSGKSAHAEDLARSGGGPVTYIATAVTPDGDDDFARRVLTHQERRPVTWRTIEAGARLTDALHSVEGTALVDSLGTWLAAHRDFEVDVDGLVAALGRDDPTIVVSEEVGFSLHAPTPVGRAFVDAVGTLNQAVASIADRVVLVVAGRALELP